MLTSARAIGPPTCLKADAGGLTRSRNCSAKRSLLGFHRWSDPGPGAADFCGQVTVLPKLRDNMGTYLLLEDLMRRRKAL